MTGPWIAAALACMAFMYAAGRFDWLRFGRRQVWREARAHFDAETRALTQQLTRAERALAERGEVEHAEIRDPRPWTNGAGYRSPRFPADSPSRPAVEVSDATAR